MALEIRRNTAAFLLLISIGNSDKYIKVFKYVDDDDTFSCNLLRMMQIRFYDKLSISIHVLCIFIGLKNKKNRCCTLSECFVTKLINYTQSKPDHRYQHRL